MIINIWTQVHVIIKHNLSPQEWVIAFIDYFVTHLNCYISLVKCISSYISPFHKVIYCAINAVYSMSNKSLSRPSGK